jgi:deoxyribodipyrimidine photo-lyase
MNRLQLPADRDARLAYMRENFPDAPGPDSQAPGGRAQAQRLIDAIDARQYAATRNHLHGKVTRLSAYLRHGCVTLEEVRLAALQKFGPSAAYKLIFELAWRDFWRRVWFEQGDAILRPIEVPKVPLGHAPLPEDIRRGASGLACIDDTVRALLDTGYVHNHARMWFAAYIVHFRKIDWRAAADWYVVHLLDGDMASNHLSWQWVASSFSSKPYFFNRENVVKYTSGEPCGRCAAMRSGTCPFDHSYEALESRLFARSGA